jgi:hypothetical protein
VTGLTVFVDNELAPYGYDLSSLACRQDRLAGVMLALGLFLLPATHALFCGVDTGKSVGIGLQRLLDTLASTTL